MSGTEEPRQSLPGRIGRVALKSELATLANDPLKFLFGKRITSSDVVVASRGRGKGLDLYDDLERDGQVGTVLDKRKAAVAGREWSLEAADETPAAQQALAIVQQALDGLAFNQAVEAMLDALLKGFSVQEVLWEAKGNLLMPVALNSKNPRRFTFFDAPGAPQLRLLTKSAPIDGEELPDRKFIVHRHGGKYGDPYGAGLGQRLFWPVFFKRQGIAFWLSALEKFGQPTVIGRFPQGTSNEKVDELLEILRAVASEAAVALPEGMVTELLEAKRSGSFDSYEKLARYMDEDIAKVVLGETLSTDSGDNGSRALGEVHDGVRLELAQADADRLSDTLNGGLVRWIVAFNALPEETAPRLWWDMTPPEDLSKRAERDGKISALGYEPTEDYIQQTYGEGWVKKAPVQPPPPGLRAPAATPAELAAFAEAEDTDVPTRLAAELDRAAGAAQDRMIETIRAELAAATDWPDLADRLARVYPRMNDVAFAELMQQALTLASLEGGNAMLRPPA